MVRGKVVRGQVEGKELGPNPSRPEMSDNERAPPTTTIKDDIERSQRSENAPKSANTAPTLDDVILVLQPLPPECPKLGLDPRMITLKPPTQTLGYEIGIWPTWSDAKFDALTSMDDRVGVAPCGDKGNAEEKEKEEGKVGEGKKERVVFASRYLIAESDTAL